MANAYLSLAFLMYLAAYKPFLDQTTFRINVWNEFSMYAVSMIYITFTDFNQDPYAKVMMGWLVVGLCIANLILPNGFVMISGLWTDAKKIRCSRKPVVKSEDTIKWDEKRSKLLETYSHRFKLKVQNKDKFDMDQPVTKINQVAPREMYKNMGSGYASIWSKKSKAQRQSRKKVKTFPERPVMVDPKYLKKKLEMSVVQEEEEEIEVEDRKGSFESDFMDGILSQMKREVKGKKMRRGSFEDEDDDDMVGEMKIEIKGKKMPKDKDSFKDSFADSYAYGIAADKKAIQDKKAPKDKNSFKDSFADSYA